jgi:hypothetical protein
MNIIRYNNEKKETTVTKANPLEVGDNQGKQLK